MVQLTEKNEMDSIAQVCSTYDVREQRGFLRNRRGRNLYYALHMPKSTTPARSIWIFCNPFFEEKVFGQGIYVQFARFLAAYGYAVMRFDCEGDGDSEGDYYLMDLTHWGDDTLDVVEFLRQLYPRTMIGLFGLRLGALAAGLAAKHAGAQMLLFWEPVLDGRKYLEEYQKINLTTQFYTSKKEVKDQEGLIRSLKAKTTINIAGYEINHKFFQQINQSKLIDVISLLRDTTQIAAVAINRLGMKTDRPEIQSLATCSKLFAMTNHQPFWYGPRFINMQPMDLFEHSLELIMRMTNSYVLNQADASVGTTQYERQ